MESRIFVGVPCYGPQENEWWSQLAINMAIWGSKYNLTLGVSPSMAADHSRNILVENFLNSSAEWLFWIDADTVVPQGAIDRLMALGKTLASGLYYGKNEPHNPIAYVKHKKAYVSIERVQNWEVGEILPVDATGMGCLLTHRSVYEDIKNNFTVLQRDNGGLIPIYKNDMEGKLEEVHPQDGKVYKGQLRTRLIEPTIENWRFPFFGLEFGRTEDIWFFELASRVGHKVWLDTSVECGHLRPVQFTGSDYREMKGH
jgi:hypothetical protein